MPWLNAGYGNFTDAWRVAYAGYLITQSGHYVASRLPGYPVHEYTASFLWSDGPLALNTISAISSAVAVGLFAIIVRRVNGPFLLASLTFAMVPIVYIASVSNIDYMWTSAFSLMATYLAMRKHAVGAGLALGLAIGTRITSAAMLLPLAYLFYSYHQKGKQTQVSQVLIFAGVASVVGITLRLQWTPLSRHWEGAK